MEKKNYRFYFTELNYGFVEIESEAAPMEEDVIEYIKRSGEAVYGDCDIVVDMNQR
jgi:hypothetical protein